MRAARLGWLYFKLGSLTELQYRANFFIQLIQSAVAVGTAIVVLKLVYSHTNELNGWSEPELLVVMGIQILLGGVIRMSIQPNMERVMEEVREGKLDFALTKPERTRRSSSAFARCASGGRWTSSRGRSCWPTASTGSTGASTQATPRCSPRCSWSARSRSTASGSASRPALSGS